MVLVGHVLCSHHVPLVLHIAIGDGGRGRGGGICWGCGRLHGGGGGWERRYGWGAGWDQEVAWCIEPWLGLTRRRWGRRGLMGGGGGLAQGLGI